ncbi:MAG: hypothetical protein KC877_01775 [Candidatus Kaiserbacteria bacterium]|nr:hypothetical protein [Candidatus Kaiserbacteria bacterium]MCB9815921.1 hypothetical protein [Candidatus Nomurabacteria bacterium]
MNTCKLKLAGWLFVFSIFLIPQASEAYFTTDQTATRLTANNILFTVTYSFGFAERDVLMPIFATRAESSDSDTLMGYEIQDDKATTALGTSAGLVLTKHPAVAIEDGKYYRVPAGEAASFTLVTLMSVTDEELDSNPDLSLLVTHLPFTMIDEGVEIPAKLNPSELQYYHTPEIDL